MKVSTILLNSPVCNFKCSYCGLCADHEETRKHLPQAITNFDVIDRIIETEYSGKKYRDGSLDIHLWGGEPLFNQNFWPLIEHLNKTFKLHSVEFVTNGSLIYPYRKELDKYDFWKLNVSNDLMYQSSRGGQYLEDKEAGDYFFKLAKEGKVITIQTVVGHHSSHVYENLEYLKNLCDKHSFDYQNFDWFLMPLRDYSCSDKGSLLTLEDKPFVEQFSRFITEALLDKNEHNIYLSTFLRLKREYNTMMSPKVEKYTPHCQSFRENEATFVTLTGERYYCTENFERGIKGNNLVVPTEECMKCVFQGSCNGGCANHSNEFRKFNCSGWKAWHALMQRVLYSGFDEEQRRRYHDLHGTSDMYEFITAGR